MAMTTSRAAWKQQKANTQDRQLLRAVRRANTHVQRVCDAAHAKFLEKYVQDLEEDLRQSD